MAIYQATISGTNYSLYTSFSAIYGNLLIWLFQHPSGIFYVAPGIGFPLALRLVVSKTDSVYSTLTARNREGPKPNSACVSRVLVYINSNLT